MPAQHGTIGAVDRSLQLVDHLQEVGWADLAEITAEFDCAKSTIHRHLETLERAEYVVREGNEYALSLKFLEHGELARLREPAYELAAEKVNEVAAETNERAQFIVEEHGRGVYVHRATGEKAVDVNTHLGKRVPIHASAAGHAILSALPEAEVDAIVERHGLEPLTDRTITDRAALAEELDRVRERGYSVNDQGFVDGLRAVGVPIADGDGGVLGGLSVAGPINRFRNERFERELPSLLLGVANELELRIAYN